MHYFGEKEMEVDIYRLLWTREQEKAFENSVATHSEYCSNRWEKIAMDVPGKTIEEVMYHYGLLIEDVNNIESGQVPLPCYVSSSESCEQANDGSTSKKGGQSHGDSGKACRSDHERKRGIIWTEDEHRLFLLGLDKYGKGDWRSISRNFVISRTPTQVASHAQKYFNRLNSMNKERRRNSIHDITSEGNADLSGPNVAVAGQSNGQVATEGKPINQSPQPSGGHPGVGTYGRPTIGRPLGNPLIPAADTPMNLPIAGTAHLVYGLRAPISGTVIPGALINIPSVNYPLPPTQSNRW